jgi:hypothetical protein
MPTKIIAADSGEFVEAVIANIATSGIGEINVDATVLNLKNISGYDQAEARDVIMALNTKLGLSGSDLVIKATSPDNKLLVCFNYPKRPK